MKHRNERYERVKREIEYYGDDPEADASFDAMIAGIDSQIDNTGTEEAQKTLRWKKSLQDFRESFFGVILFGIVIPFGVIFLFFGLPLMIASSFTFIPNWALRIFAILFGFSFLANSLSSLGHFGFETILSGIVYLFGTWGMYLGVVQKRCPKCHHSNSKIIRTITNKLNIKKFIKLPNGDRELLESSTSTDYDDDHRCHNCGYEWRTNRDF